ncbi:MAG: hypothetical protein N2376_10940 [Clostridia bacterium]|nr:hypothetical protein [Clostridia bacterium]
MSLFIDEETSCEKMSFEEFQQKVLATVRTKNHMDLVNSWEKHIIFKELKSGTAPSSDIRLFYATVYYADEIFRKDEFKVKIYNFKYHEHDDYRRFSCTEGDLYKEELQAITRISNCFSRNKGRFFDCTLDDYQKRYGEASFTKDKEL